jgi:hypothetical protein
LRFYLRFAKCDLKEKNKKIRASRLVLASSITLQLKKEIRKKNCTLRFVSAPFAKCDQN